MNNEPVAWLWNEDGCNLGVVLDQDKQIGKQEFQDYSIPLYTHQAKTLTDEEIDLIAGMVPTIPTGWDLIEFAKAILRKASEK